MIQLDLTKIGLENGLKCPLCKVPLIEQIKDKEIYYIHLCPKCKRKWNTLKKP